MRFYFQSALRLGIILLLITGFCGLESCGSGKFKYQTDPEIIQRLTQSVEYPAVRFGVMSDLHYYDPSLGAEGAAFDRYMKRDRKMLPQSREIITEAAAELGSQGLDFVIVCGDLTKDGETINHEGVIRILRNMAAKGIVVYVVPGNHDVDNGSAVRFTGDGVVPVKALSHTEFEKIYAAFGYAQALEKDTDSLSYLVSPAEGIWLLALDSCRWKENIPGEHPVTGGGFSAETLTWIESILIRAKKAGKPVIACMHHGILAHYPGNQKYYARYLVKDHERIAELLAAYGVSLVFTGHFHAQDITARRLADGKRYLYDIETGSLVSYPIPYRIVTIGTDQRASVESRYVKWIPSMGDGFYNAAETFMTEHTRLLANRELKKYWVSSDDRKQIIPWVVDAYRAHLQGDERKPKVFPDATGLGLLGRITFWMRKDLIEGWWTDLPPADNQVVIDLRTGPATLPHDPAECKIEADGERNGN